MKKVFQYILLFILIAIPIVLLILPADYFNDGRPMCASVLFLGIECFACGITRGIMHLIHLDFTTAYYYNPLTFIAFPFLVWYYLRLLSRQFNKVLAKPVYIPFINPQQKGN